MATTNLTQSGTHTEIFRESLCSPLWLSILKKTVHFILSSQHSPPHHSDSWEYSYHHCPSQGVFPPPAIQTLVPVSRNNWSVGWSCYPSSYAAYWMSVVYEDWSFCRPLVQYHNYIIWSSNLSRLVHKDFPRFQSSSGWNTRLCSTTAEPTKCTEHGVI